ncbi:MAG: GNAT family N-acetyltransferase [Pseudomonadales bacterium]|nr:GNAT family N-acetyltransferase [Pseudomonadales bacterium]
MLVEVQPLNELNMDVYLACGGHPRDARFDEAYRERMDCKRGWVERMLPRGLGARIAFLEDYPAGFAEFMPIEVAPAPVIGEGLLFLTEVHVNSEDKGGALNLEKMGVGQMLIRAVEQYAREQGFAGLVTVALEGTWLPESFYENMGFTLIQQDDEVCLLWKPFKECPQPELWSGNFEPTVRDDGVHVDVIHTSQCPGATTLGLWQEIAGEYGPRVSFAEHLADDRSIMDIDCLTGCMGVFVNGKRAPCRPISADKVRDLLDEALSRIPLSDRT